MSGPILWPETVGTEDRRRLGGKAGALRRMGEAGLPVPPWFVVPPDAPDTPQLRAAIAEALDRISPDGRPVAVRSSAVDEDGSDHSFAGQFESFLNVAPADVAARVADVRRSGLTERVLAYRAEKGLSADAPLPAALVQRMVAADAAGVAFSADPVSGRRGVAVVAAVAGLGDALVGGDADADTWEVDRDGAVRSCVAVRGTPLLADEQVREIAALARKAERLACRPQDIEWAREGDRLYLLQSRPITTLAGTADPEGTLQVWDNSNIVESYGGVTTPLTFSFARGAYQSVYREFCRLLGVSEERIAASDREFRGLLGLIRGRVYYNLPNWHRLLALLPGYRMNRTFMEQMMGVREPLPEEVTGISSAPATRSERLRDTAALVRVAFGLIGSYRRLPASITAFYARLSDALASSNDDLERMRPEELAAHYRDLERRLLTRWDAPLVNDFFAMLFHGLLRRLGARWITGEGAENLHNDLVSGEGGMVSAEPARRVSEMARLAAGDDAAIAALRDLPAADALRRIERDRPDLYRELTEYLDRFGDRCLEELKLESPTLHDDPTSLLRAVGGLAARGPQQRAAPGDEPTPREAAEARVAAALRGKPLRSRVYRSVLRAARDRVRDRENLRFERTRVFGRVRRVFVEIGRRLVSEGMLDDPRDVFYLETEEALGVIEGTATSWDVRALARARREEFEHLRTLPTPPDRLETRGMVAAGGGVFVQEEPGPAQSGGEGEDGETRKGLACCPGRVVGRVRVIADPRGATLAPGEILVAERTDPGWVLLFPAAAGLLVERGSLLSHSAIVARELRIPCIVSLAGLTGWLRDGDRVEMDGSTGVVRRLAAEEA